MRSILESPARSLGLGAVIALVLLIAWLALAGADRMSLVSSLLRWLHVLGAMIWVGLIFFVNFVQLIALSNSEEAQRPVLLELIVPKVAVIFRHAAHLTVVSGILLLIATGYFLDRMAFSAEVFIPPLRNLMLWAGVIGGLAMWGFVQFLIWPALQIVLGVTPASLDETALARARIATYARWNLVIAIPVSFVMVAAAHL